MNALIQFLTFDQTSGLLNLFNLANKFIGQEGLREKYSWIDLNLRKKSVDSFKKLYSTIGRVKFSQIGYEAAVKPFDITTKVKIKDVFGTLQVSGTSSLWADSAYWNASNATLGYRRSTAADDFSFVAKKSRVREFPSVLELTLKIASKCNVDEVSTALAERLAHVYNQKPMQCFDCGVVDLGDDMLFSKLDMVNRKANALSLVQMNYVLGIPLLKTHIDRLHNIHIFRPSVLNGIAKLLELDKPKRVSAKQSILVIPSRVLNSPEIKSVDTTHFIPQDDTTSWAGIKKREMNAIKNSLIS